MKFLFLVFISMFFFEIHALEYEIQLENDAVNVSRVLIMPHEEIGLHRDTHSQIVIGLQGGIITRLETDGSVNDIHFPTGKAVFRNVDPPDQLHKSVNNSDKPIELIIIQLKK